MSQFKKTTTFTELSSSKPAASLTWVKQAKSSWLTPSGKWQLAKTSTSIPAEKSNLKASTNKQPYGKSLTAPAHNRHYVRSLATLNSVHKCRYVRSYVRQALVMPVVVNPAEALTSGRAWSSLLVLDAERLVGLEIVSKTLDGDFSHGSCCDLVLHQLVRCVRQLNLTAFRRVFET